MSATVDLAPGPLCARLAERAVGAMAARAGLSVERLDDAVLLVEALVARCGPAPMRLQLEAGDGELRLQAGPFTERAARALLEERPVGTAKPLLQALADDAAVRMMTGDVAYVSLRLLAR